MVAMTIQFLKSIPANEERAIWLTITSIHLTDSTAPIVVHLCRPVLQTSFSVSTAALRCLGSKQRGSNKIPRRKQICSIGSRQRRQLKEIRQLPLPPCRRLEGPFLAPGLFSSTVFGESS